LVVKVISDVVSVTKKADDCGSPKLIPFVMLGSFKFNAENDLIHHG
jgi:hypothetical protein